MCLALVIFFEAGAENDIGQAAVGWSVVTSARTLHRHPHRVCREVFSGRYIGVNQHYPGHAPAGARWKRALKMSRNILAGRVADPTDGATNFECTLWDACVDQPWWSVDMEYRGVYGTQRFWRPKNGRQ